MRGYITLIAVLIITSVGMVLALVFLEIAGHGADTAAILEKGYAARAYADACAEAGLFAITSAEAYSGSDSQDFSNGSCTYSVSIPAPGESVVESEGSSLGAVRYVRVTAMTEQYQSEMGTSTRIIDYEWEEVSE